MKGNLFMLVTLSVCIIAYVYNPEQVKSLLNKVFNKLILSDDASNDALKVLTKKELSLFKGENNGKVYLAILGHVYDVTRGRRHYGPGGGYEFFAGIDGSKAYITGKFDQDGLIDDISELSTSEIGRLEEWKEFYDKDYKFVGKVEGAFFDKEGKELPMMKLYKDKLKAALLEKDLIDKDHKLFPPCNSEWSKATGGRVWCTAKSGGIARDWIGVPRMYFSAGSSKPRCACVRISGPPSHDLNSKNHKNRGDLENPNLNLYPNCHEMSDSCPLPDDQ